MLISQRLFRILEKILKLLSNFGDIVLDESLLMLPVTARRVIVGLLVAAALPVCLAQSVFSPDVAAKAVAVTGQVSILKDNYPWALSVGSGVTPRQVIVSGPDGFAVFQVSDGSTFEVYPNSRVVFRNNPGNWRDLLEVMIGRVKVHIQKLGGQPNPNRVRTATAVISVRGTVFDVVVEDEDATTLVSVDEGQVDVQHSLLPHGQPRILNAGEYLRVYRNQPLAQKGLDKSSVWKVAMRAIEDAFYTIVYRTGGTGGVGAPTGGGGPTLPGDTQGTPPPPPPPPPTAPPPPPPGN